MTDRIILACIIVLAGIYFYFTAQIPSLAVGDPLGPKVYPYLLGIGLLICAGLLAGEMVRARRKQKPAPAPAAGHAGTQPATDRRYWWAVGAVCAWFAVYVYFFDRLGFIVATALFLLALMTYFHRGHWVVNVVISVLFSVGAFLLFDRVLGVMLPAGLVPL